MRKKFENGVTFTFRMDKVQYDWLSRSAHQLNRYNSDPVSRGDLVRKAIRVAYPIPKWFMEASNQKEFSLENDWCEEEMRRILEGDTGGDHA